MDFGESRRDRGGRLGVREGVPGLAVGGFPAVWMCRGSSVTPGPTCDAASAAGHGPGGRGWRSRDVSRSRYGRFYASEVGEGIKVLSAKEKMAMRETEQIRLSFGDPTPDSFPNDEVLEALALALQDEPDRVLQYGAGEVAEDLRAFLLERAASRGMPASRDELLVTNGATEALDLICRIFLDPSDVIMTEAPTFMGALSVFRKFGVQIEGCGVDGDGLRTDILEAKLNERLTDGEPMPKFLYVIANFQNPTGTTMALERRRHLLELASRFDFLIVEDEAYGELRLEGEDVPTLWALDEEGRVLHVGTFSKVIAPGLRLGWVFAAGELIAQLEAMRPGYSNGASESLAAKYCRMLDFDDRVASVRAIYRERRDVMLEALEQNMPAGVTWNRPAGGLFIWMEIPGDIDPDEFVEEAARRGVALLKSSIFYPDGGKGRGLRLSYSLESLQALRGAAEIMGDLLRELKSRS